MGQSGHGPIEPIDTEPIDMVSLVCEMSGGIHT